MPRRALVLGCGGTLGFAWTACALAALERELHWDAREAEILVGTSAGAEMAALLGAGIGTAEVVAALYGDPVDPRVAAHVRAHPGKLPPIPGAGWPGVGLTLASVRRRVDLLAGLAGLLPRGRGDASWLRELGVALAGPDDWVAHPATWLVAADVRSGTRTAFGSPDAPPAPLGDAIAASWAIPGWFPPVRVAGRRYVDGGTVSPTSADLLLRGSDGQVPPVDEAVVVAPMSTAGGAPGRGLSRLERLARQAMTRRVDAEVAQLEAAGIRVVRIEPGPDELAVMGPNFMDLRRRTAVLDAGRTMTAIRVRDAVREGAGA
jgi:NTE family protein